MTDITKKITILAELKDEWYALHSRLMGKEVLSSLDEARARRCRVEIVLIDKRIASLKSEYRDRRYRG
jgi:hypothetical protein